MIEAGYRTRTTRSDSEMQGRLVRSYELMLDFYGCILDKKTEEIKRNPETFEERYKFLNNSSHNYLRRFSNVWE